ncbi:MAG: hypothetical protein NTX57_14435 [Armatimonadetes bacterium]|jgi:hypothetical protein|nr:hypothetical protein [Armatimonadota bacterium]
MKRLPIAIFAVGMLSGLVLAPSASAQLDKLLKGGAIVVAIDKFGGDINNFVDRLVGNPPKSAETRVVPILSIGKGTYAGAAQITGPKAQVDKVRAIAQIEGDARLGLQIRVKGLIPVESREVKNLDSLKRVAGVGVTGLIDAKL